MKICKAAVSLFLLFLYPLLFFACSGGTPKVSFTEDSFTDFADGTLDAAGQNIYISHDGAIRTIHRFDLNTDGWLDLIFNSTHNDYVRIPATIAHGADSRSVMQDSLLVMGSLYAVVEDLDGDEYPEIIFCPNHPGIQRYRRFVTILWGGADGWPPSRSNGLLPVQSVKDVAVADLNADGRKDIVTLNGEPWLFGQPEGNVLRIYWGADNGYSILSYSDYGIAGAYDLVSGDFDGNGSADIAALVESGAVEIIWSAPGAGTSADNRRSRIELPEDNTLCIEAGMLDGDNNVDMVIGTDSDEIIYVIDGMAGRGRRTVRTVPAFKASDITIADADGDGKNDLILSYFTLVLAQGGEMTGAGDIEDTTIEILWGKDDFSTDTVTKLEARYHRSAAVLDFDNDGFNDIVAAVHQGDSLYRAESLVFYGSGGGNFELGNETIITEGAWDAVAVPAHNGIPASVIICNSKGGNLREEVPVNVYWGGRQGFDPENRLQIPHRSGYEATAADLDIDGYPDLMLIDEMHGGQTAAADPWHGLNIFRGGPDGFDIEAREVLHEKNAGTSNVADFNKDGRLDIVIGHFNHRDGSPTELAFWYGSEDGFTIENRKSLLCEGRSLSTIVGDYDRDGWLDVAVNSAMKDLIRVFYGSPQGFSAENRDELTLPFAIDLEAADLNADGWLDIIGCSYMDKVNDHNDMGLMLFWGSQVGFSYRNAQKLPGFTPLAPVVADFDGDGYLDIFSPHYHGELTREQLPSYLFWNSAEGFHPLKRTELINNSAADGFAADFDRDGLMDLAVTNHTRDGFHNLARSKVFYNGGNRFRNPTHIEYLPSPGAHWSWNEDMGHIYDRSYRQTYISSPFEWEADVSGLNITADADIPPEALLTFQYRTAENVSSIDDAAWKNTTGGKGNIPAGHNCLQYMAVLSSSNGDRYPVVDAVSIDLY